jgi:hypothetical protein
VPTPFRGVPPFAQPYVSYTKKFASFIGGLQGIMTIRDLADIFSFVLRLSNAP